MIKVQNITLGLDEREEVLKEKAAKILRVSEDQIKGLQIEKQSIDARKKPLKFVYSILVELKDEETVLRRVKNPQVMKYEASDLPHLQRGEEKLRERPIIVGLGPSGLFAGLKLAMAGYRPIILEQGEDMDKRDESVDKFMQTGVLNPMSNLQFGEGGAGAYSDGKLTTRIKDPRVTEVLDTLIRHGAPDEIAYQAKPHVGTDLLKGIVVDIRKEIISLGGDIYFNTAFTGLELKGGKLSAIKTTMGDLPCEILLLALGHSARDTYEMLFNSGVAMEAKPMAMGVRVESLQWRINESQYGSDYKHPRLRPAEYRLKHKLQNGRGVYSFCMCPGGIVVPAASEEGMVAVNGMSYHDRAGTNANSAIVVSVTPRDFGHHPLDGIAFQRSLEKAAYDSSKDFKAPVQKVEDFFEGKISSDFTEVIPSYLPGVTPNNLKDMLPGFISDSLDTGLREFERKVPGFTKHGAVMTGVETRTSSPLRILRSPALVSINVGGLYPVGEGAGYAGGIVSSAVDGLKVAEAIMAKYRSFD